MKGKYKKIKERIVDTSKLNLNKEQLVLLESYRDKTTETKQGDVTVYIGDVNKALRLLPEGVIDCVVTSPPYWKQRDYKNPQQIGQESTYQEYIKRLVDAFNQIKRVLKPTGTFFLNVGYKYQNKELLLIPELLAVELQKNGWALLNKIIWQKPNAMPSSLDSRFSNVYEPVFLFVKEESKYKYYLSVDELRLPVSNFKNNKKPEEVLGFEVVNSLLRDRKVKGAVSKIFENALGNIFAQVEWEGNNRTVEIVNDFDKDSQNGVDLVCPECGKTIRREIDITDHANCKKFPRPILPPKPDFDNGFLVSS